MKKTEDLIHSLTADLKPVIPLASPLKRFLRWLLIAIFSVMTGMAIFGIRENIEVVVKDWNFWAQTGLMSVMALASALSSIFLSVPGKDRSFVIRWLPLFTLLAWVIVIFYGVLSETGHTAGRGLACIRDIIVIGLVPGVALFLMLLQGMVFRRPLAGLYSFLAVAALGSLGTQFICSNDSSLHLLAWHCLPVLLLGALGFYVGKSLLKRP